MNILILSAPAQKGKHEIVHFFVSQCFPASLPYKTYPHTTEPLQIPDPAAPS